MYYCIKKIKHVKNKAYTIFKNSNSDTNETNFNIIKREYDILNKFVCNKIKGNFQRSSCHGIKSLFYV